jgi:hypothetical protein
VKVPNVMDKLKRILPGRGDVIDEAKLKSEIETMQYLSALTASIAWRNAIEPILHQIEIDNMDKLIKSDNPEARGGLKAIKEFRMKIQEQIERGIASRAKLSNGLENPSEQTNG